MKTQIIKVHSNIKLFQTIPFFLHRLVYSWNKIDLKVSLAKPLNAFRIIKEKWSIHTSSFVQYHYSPTRFQALLDRFWAIGFWRTHPITWKQACKQYSAFVWPLPATTNIKLTRSNSAASEKRYRQEMWNIIIDVLCASNRNIRYNTFRIFQKSIDQLLTI